MTISLRNIRSLKYTGPNRLGFRRFPLFGRLSTPTAGVLAQIGLSIPPIDEKLTKHGGFSRISPLRTERIEQMEGVSVGLVHDPTGRFSVEFPVYEAVFAHFR